MSNLVSTVVGIVTSTPGLRAKDEALLAEALVRAAKEEDRSTVEALLSAALAIPRADQVVSQLASRMLRAVSWRDRAERRNGGSMSVSKKTSYEGYANAFARHLARGDLLGANTALGNARRVARSAYPAKWAQDALSEVAAGVVLLKKAGWEGEESRKNSGPGYFVIFFDASTPQVRKRVLAMVESVKGRVVEDTSAQVEARVPSRAAADALLHQAFHYGLDAEGRVRDFKGPDRHFYRKNGSTSETAKGVSEIIAKQMGGLRRLVVMIGAKHFVYGTDDDGDFFSFQFPNKARSKPNYVKIVYRKGSDTYRVRFGRIAKWDFTEGPVFDDIYADQLKPLFERTTGLYLSL